MGLFSSIGSVLSNPTIALGALAGAGTAYQNYTQQKLANQQMDFQRDMSNTAYQRAMADMRLAGLNPILASKLGGASSPAGAMAQMQNIGAQSVSSGLQAMQTSSNVKLQDAQENLTKVKKDIADGEVPKAKIKENIWSGVRDGVEMLKNAVTSMDVDKAKSMLKEYSSVATYFGTRFEGDIKDFISVQVK
jgi:hypothetical protein